MVPFLLSEAPKRTYYRSLRQQFSEAPKMVGADTRILFFACLLDVTDISCPQHGAVRSGLSYLRGFYFRFAFISLLDFLRVFHFRLRFFRQFPNDISVIIFGLDYFQSKVQESIGPSYCPQSPAGPTRGLRPPLGPRFSKRV